MAVTDNAGIGLAMNMGQLSLTRNYPQISSESKADQLYDQQQAALEERERHQKQQQQHLQQQYQQVQYEQPQQHQQGEQGQSQEQHQSQNQAHASSAPQKPGLSGGQGHGQGQHPQVVRSNRANGANGVNGHIKAENGSNGGDDEGHTLDARSNVSNDSMRELEDLLTKLNPLAKEFVPPSHADLASTTAPSSVASSKGQPRKKNGFNQVNKRRVNSRTSRAQREDSIRRTVYVSDIDQQVTEEQLAALFITCGQVVDCRVCGDPNSVLRFAFVEFTDEEGARAALSLAGTMLGYYPVRVLPSKTAIVPVNPTFLPRSEDEREMCARTIYCTNIDKKVSQADVKLFFESLCGEVARLRLLGDYHHSTRIAFVEFVMAESAMAALNCSGAILGSLPIRVSPSKTPVRPRSPRSPLH
ncbi:polyadenylate-binding protein-interacting protein 8 isoform X2 [Physcomitrium patens]|uniref:RRM domain-containing protein n=1 Tax=Physcomitrium patens TaxID=3218 RepID=A0A7I4CY66_PHYPA|nr:polyadenylate-binding protein-interacting protein 12-like isoform X2 [Physcomitrium patens]|eukprot:XP_024364565.1 polyadenylate-binding protein-interacting protein 12-like isoform X2 [Physcomitrella patens]